METQTIPINTKSISIKFILLLYDFFLIDFWMMEKTVLKRMNDSAWLHRTCMIQLDIHNKFQNLSSFIFLISSHLLLPLRLTEGNIFKSELKLQIPQYKLSQSRYLVRTLFVTCFHACERNGAMVNLFLFRRISRLIISIF